MDGWMDGWMDETWLKGLFRAVQKRIKIVPRAAETATGWTALVERATLHLLKLIYW